MIDARKNFIGIEQTTLLSRGSRRIILQLAKIEIKIIFLI
jgi:hypothetical protein